MKLTLFIRANFAPILLMFFLVFAFTNCTNESEDGIDQDRIDEVYRINGTLTVDAHERTYLLNLPPGYYDEIDTLPLIIGLHGLGGNARQFEDDYYFTDKANVGGFISVYPEGVKSDGILGLRSWNAGNCCDYAQEQNINDVKFISNLIDYLVSKYKINPKKVYVTGMSNGGMMAYRLGVEMPEKIAAIAPVSSTLMMSAEEPSSVSIPLVHIHSALDTKVPYVGGKGLGGYYFPPVDSVLKVWSQRNGCSGDIKILEENAQYKLSEFSNCNNRALVKCYLTKDGGHSWPGGKKSNNRGDDPSIAIDATAIILDFFRNY